MNLEIDTLLTNTILNGKNVSIWKGDYVADKLDKMLARLSWNRGRNVVSSSALEKSFNERNIEYSYVPCWMPSGEYGIRLSSQFTNIRYSVFFEVSKVVLQLELNAFMIDKKVFDITYANEQSLVDELVAIDNEVDVVCNDWNVLVEQCVKKAKMIVMQHTAAEGYLRQSLKDSDLVFQLHMTSECTVVFLIAEGEKELTTSLTLTDNVRLKIDALIDEMKIWMESRADK